MLNFALGAIAGATITIFVLSLCLLAKEHIASKK
jgi:hypothetical protein